MSYITNSNAEQLISSLQIKDLNLAGRVYKINLEFLNKFDTNLLLATKLFFQNPEEFYTEKYVKHSRKHDAESYVYEYEFGPAYHATHDCKRLLSDYVNYKIPVQIKIKGTEEISRYRKWFEGHEHLLENKPQQFLNYLYANFNVQISASALALLRAEYKNSGAIEMDNIDLDTLESSIDELIKDANSFSASNGVIMAKYVKHTYLWNKPDQLFIGYGSYSDTEIREVLRTFETKFKQPLIKKLKEYYRIKFNPELELKSDLLSQLGFVSCQTCHKNIEVDMINF